MAYVIAFSCTKAPLPQPLPRLRGRGAQRTPTNPATSQSHTRYNAPDNSVAFNSIDGPAVPSTLAPAFIP